MASIEAFRSDLLQLVRLAESDLDVVWRGASDAVSAEAILIDVLPDLVSVYGSAAGTLAADWYDEARETAEIRGRFRALVAQLPDGGRTDALAGWAVGPLYSSEPDFATALSKAQGGLQRIIADAGRSTIAGSAVADPGARGWQRTGSGECAFCRMLIGRGAVYTEATVRFRSHDHCNCAAVPAWEGHSLPVARGSAPTPPARQASVPETVHRTPVLTNDQYKQLKPAWSLPKQKKVVAELRSTPDGKMLHDTLKGFQSGTSRQIPLLRTNIEKRLAGEALEPGAAQRVDNLLSAIKNSPLDPPKKLYRGMRLDGSADDIVARYSSSDHIDLNLSSFSSDKKLAQDFTIKGAGQKGPKSSTQTGVLIELEGGPGVKALPIENLAPSRVFANEKEWISGGRFEVESVTTTKDGTVLLRLRQIAALGD
jgi:hypothetical protein